MDRRPDDVGPSNRTFLHAKQFLVLRFVLFVTILCLVGWLVFEILPLFLPESKAGLLDTVSDRLWWAFSALMAACVTYAFGMSLKWPPVGRGRGGDDSDD